jgi:hypothetical protein
MILKIQKLMKNRKKLYLLLSWSNRLEREQVAASARIVERGTELRVRRGGLMRDAAGVHPSSRARRGLSTEPLVRRGGFVRSANIAAGARAGAL